MSINKTLKQTFVKLLWRNSGLIFFIEHFWNIGYNAVVAFCVIISSMP